MEGWTERPTDGETDRHTDRQTAQGMAIVSSHSHADLDNIFQMIYIDISCKKYTLSNVNVVYRCLCNPSTWKPLLRLIPISEWIRIQNILVDF